MTHRRSRTRSRAVARALSFALLVACDRGARETGSAPTESPPDLAHLGQDAGLEPTADPPAPAGDLAQDLARFTNLDACVKERSALDPLAFDALRGIGYDTFLRDACRMLEAARDKKRASCERIDASGLRTLCASWVAQLSEAPDQCPLAFEGIAARGRVPTCVAIAAKDARLCAAEPKSAARATCEAVIAREPARCDALSPQERVVCQREVARWKSALPSPLTGLPALPPASGTLTLEPEAGSPAPPEATVDLAPELRHGLVVVTGRGRARVVLGALGESELARIPGALTKRTRLGLGIAKTGDAPATIEQLELEIAGEAPMVTPTAKCACKVVAASVPTRRGEAVTVSLEGTVTGATRAYRIKLDARSFVRDVVTDDHAFVPAPPTLRAPTHE